MTDYMRGMLAADAHNAVANRLHAQNLAEADRSAASWMNYARNLESKLQAKEQELRQVQGLEVIHHGLADGRKEVVGMLKDALQKLDPNHPLLKEGMTAGIVQDMAGAYASSQGYDFNPRTYGVRRRG